MACALGSGTVSKWLTMRELIRAEERLMFARHSQPQPSREETLPDVSAEEETDPSALGLRLPLSRKELY